MAEKTADKDEGEEETIGYIIAVSVRNTSSTLHRVGGCWMVKGLRFGNYEVMQSPPWRDDYSKYCKSCWPNENPGRFLDTGFESSQEDSERSST